MSVKEENKISGLKLKIGKLRSWYLVHHFMKIEVGKEEAVTDFTFFSCKLLQKMTAAMKLKGTCSLEEKL